MNKASNINENDQRLIFKTNILSPNHPYAKVWVIECGNCHINYLINSCDFHIRNCPYCNPDAKPGFVIERP